MPEALTYILEIRSSDMMIIFPLLRLEIYYLFRDI